MTVHQSSKRFSFKWQRKWKNIILQGGIDYRIDRKKKRGGESRHFYQQNDTTRSFQSKGFPVKQSGLHKIITSGKAELFKLNLVTLS